MLDGVNFAIQDGGQQSFPFKLKHCFLVSEWCELSKNAYTYKSKKIDRKYITTQTKRLTVDITVSKHDLKLNTSIKIY